MYKYIVCCSWKDFRNGDNSGTMDLSCCSRFVAVRVANREIVRFYCLFITRPRALRFVNGDNLIYWASNTIKKNDFHMHSADVSVEMRHIKFQVHFMVLRCVADQYYEQIVFVKYAYSLTYIKVRFID